MFNYFIETNAMQEEKLTKKLHRIHIVKRDNDGNLCVSLGHQNCFPLLFLII